MAFSTSWEARPSLSVSVGASNGATGAGASPMPWPGYPHPEQTRLQLLVITKLLFLLQEALEQQNCLPGVCSLAAWIRAALIAGYN